MHAMSLFDAQAEARARATDPSTSHLAAVSVQPANSELVTYIRRALERWGPLTQEQIAAAVQEAQPRRWLTGTIVSACARAGLSVYSQEKNERGRWVTVWYWEPDEITVDLTGDVL